MEFTLVFKDHEGWFLKDTNGNYYPFKFPAPGIGGGGGGGKRGIIVENQGTEIGRFLILNFKGAGVTATDGGNELANITIPGGGSTIPSLTTAQREALVPTTALIVEDIDLDTYYKWSTVTNSWSPF